MPKLPSNKEYDKFWEKEELDVNIVDADAVTAEVTPENISEPKKATRKPKKTISGDIVDDSETTENEKVEEQIVEEIKEEIVIEPVSDLVNEPVIEPIIRDVIITEAGI
jgi:hypothetical protein